MQTVYGMFFSAVSMAIVNDKQSVVKNTNIPSAEISTQTGIHMHIVNFILINLNFFIFSTKGLKKKSQHLYIFRTIFVNTHVFIYYVTNRINSTAVSFFWKDNFNILKCS